MRLKLVGGPGDGQVANLAPGDRDFAYQYVLSEDRKAGLIQHQIVPYTVRTIKLSGGGEIKYLAPSGWTDLQALECQFSK